MTEPAEYQPNADTRSVDVPPMLEHLREVAAAMRSMLDACRKDGEAPEVEEVHRLRTGTRRVEATLETLAREAGARGLGKTAEEARQRWLRQLKKVRRASGTVRDFDVHRELLAEKFLPAADPGPDATGLDALHRELADTAASGADGSIVQNHHSRDHHVQDHKDPLTEQALALDAWLKAHRSDAAQALCNTLNDHAARLLDAEQQFMAAIEKSRSAMRRTHRPAVRLALEDYLRLMDALPHLDRENLHDFRKGAKKARYVAESDDKDPAAEAMAKAIKRVQDAIGEWHDWDVVRGEAREALHRDGAVLEAELEARANRAYERAMRITANMGRRFIGEWQASRLRRRRVRITSQKST
jgi:CHAD domain-containing protein